MELTKAYSDSQSYSFVNGILASVIKAIENGEIAADNIDAVASAESAAADAQVDTEAGNGNG